MQTHMATTASIKLASASGCNLSSLMALLHTMLPQRDELCFCNADHQKVVRQEAEAQCSRRWSKPGTEDPTVSLACAHLALPSICSGFCICCIGKVRFPARDHGVGWLNILLQRFPTLYIAAEHCIPMVFESTALCSVSRSTRLDAAATAQSSSYRKRTLCGPFVDSIYLHSQELTPVNIHATHAQHNHIPVRQPMLDHLL